MQRLIYYLFKAMAALFSLIPFPVLYLISDGLYYLFYYAVRYRKKVIDKNLRNSFPEKSEKEIEQITQDFYRNFCDIFLEGLKGLSMSKEELVKRYKIINAEILTPYYNSGQGIITVGSHYTNWEWGVLASSLQVKHKTLGFYKPLSNKLIDEDFKKSRAAWGMYLVSIFETAKAFAENRDTPCAYILLSDQSPARKDADKSFWIRFLNQDTAFLHGMEKYATVNKFPVFFLDIKRLKRGFYTVELSQLQTATPEKPGSLTKAYAAKLESIIRANPANWLWSHNRWKLKRESHHEFIP
ncbi:MAG: Lipid A biosynthesis lauroyltransferase [Bacteroidia bacterium]|nr:Lipid A biosynthesis lauroyltransferase [Bacteroidia bacterium]